MKSVVVHNLRVDILVFSERTITQSNMDVLEMLIKRAISVSRTLVESMFYSVRITD